MSDIVEMNDKDIIELQKVIIDELKKENKVLVSENNGLTEKIKKPFADKVNEFFGVMERASNIDANDMYERSSEASHYNWLDDEYIRLTEQLESANEVIEQIPCVLTELYCNCKRPDYTCSNCENKYDLNNDCKQYIKTYLKK